MPSSGILKHTCSKYDCIYLDATTDTTSSNSNSTSLAEVDEAFHDDTCSDLLTPHSPPNNGRDQSQAPEGRDDALKWVKLELIKQVGMSERHWSFDSSD
jgi:hypothetical protein